MANNTSDDELRKILKQFRLGGKPKSAWWTEYDEASLDKTVLAFKQREEQAALEARIDELNTTVFKPLQGRTWLDVRPDIELARISMRRNKLDQLTTTHKGDK